MVEEKLDMKIEYGKLRKKYTDLLNFEEINNEIEIDSIEKYSFLSRRIRRRLIDRIIVFCKILENIIYPSLQNPISNYEASFFNEVEKENMVNLHKSLMILERRSLNLDIECCSEEKDVAFIIEALKELPNYKSQMSEFLNKMENSWKSDLKEEGEKYFG